MLPQKIRSNHHASVTRERCPGRGNVIVFRNKKVIDSNGYHRTENGKQRTIAGFVGEFEPHTLVIINTEKRIKRR